MIPLRDALPTRRTPVINYALIAANVGIFLYERSLIASGIDPADLLDQWALVPVRALSDPLRGFVTIFSAMFMHDPMGWAHIGGNMLFLWIFGDNVEDALGRARYLVFYLVCGTIAFTAQVAIDPQSQLPMLGASGAIAGVLAAYGTLYPRAPIAVLNPILPLWLFFGPFLYLPAWFIIAEFFVVNLVNGYASIGATQGGVAFVAHVGGFVAGLVLIRVFMLGKARRPHDPWGGWRAPRPRVRDLRR